LKQVDAKVLTDMDIHLYICVSMILSVKTFMVFVNWHLCINIYE